MKFEEHILIFISEKYTNNTREDVTSLKHYIKYNQENLKPNKILICLSPCHAFNIIISDDIDNKLKQINNDTQPLNIKTSYITQYYQEPEIDSYINAYHNTCTLLPIHNIN